MATVITNIYPTSDGKPMAETDWHRKLMVALIETLQFFYLSESLVYVSGNLLVFYVPGNKRKHCAPDVFVVKGVSKHDRPNYLIWEEGESLDLVIEITSSSTQSDDTKRKFLLYQDVLKVQEYFLFDPLGDYLKPALRGYRLHRGKYKPIELVDGRLPSGVLGLHLEKDGRLLRLYEPTTHEWLPTPEERAEAAEEQAEAAAEQATEQAERAARAEARSRNFQQDNARLLGELDELRRRFEKA